MEPNDKSIYKENKEYFQILEKQWFKRIDKLIQRVKRDLAECQRGFTRFKEPVVDHHAEIRYYQRKLSLNDKFKGNIASDLQPAEIQGKWPGKPNISKSFLNVTL